MSKSLDDVIRNVEHLLRHARSSEEIGYTEEADTYLAAAQRIMSRYRIEESQLFNGNDSDSSIVRREYPIKGAYFLDKAILMNSVAVENFCRVLQGKGYVALYGHNSDIEFTITLYESLLLDMIVQMESGLKKRREQDLDFNVTSWKKSFFTGYSSRIAERLASIRNSSNGDYALVVTNREHTISEFWEELTKDRVKSTRYLSSLEGFNSGKVSADAVDLGQTKISNADTVS